MNFNQFKQHFEPFRVFSLGDILKWKNRFDTRRLVEWQDKGYIVKIINRWYMFVTPKTTTTFDYLIANRIYSPSYISFQSAWAYYGLIPEGVYSVTSATSLKTHTFKTPVGVFSYRHLKPSLHFGYRISHADGQAFKIAEPEKLVIDHLYLDVSLKSSDDFEALRINQALLKEQISLDKLFAYLALVKNKALEKRIDLFIKTYEL